MTQKGDAIMKAELLKGLTEEQIAKVKACNGVGDILELAKMEGVELSAEQLSAVSGGGCSDDNDGKKHKKIDARGPKINP